MATRNFALQKTSIRDLDPNFGSILIVGIIIGKQRPRKFLDTKISVDSYKGVWNFTIRDSPQDYINVTYWSSSEVVYQADSRFCTGDIVAIINPRIIVRKINDFSEQFRPMVTSPFTLTMNEKSDIIRHEGDPRYYLNLLRNPTKPIAGFLPIRDIHNSGESIKDTKVDILGAVRGLGIIRNVTAKTNENLQVRTVEVFDHTAPSLKVEIWEPDIIMRSNNWKPRSTVLFFTDMCIVWSGFQKSFVAKVTSRSIVTENPEGREADVLMNYAKTAPIETFEIVEQLVMALPKPNTVQDVMSIKHVQDKINIIQETGCGIKQFTALVFSFVSSLDLDGFSKTLLTKCGRCHLPMKGQECEDAECATVFEAEAVEPEINFDIRVTLTDHTGTLTNCHFSGRVAEQALNCTAYAFSQMSDEQKCSLKWKYLLERCAVYLAVSFIGMQTPIISVIDLSLADTGEAASRLPVY